MNPLRGWGLRGRAERLIFRLATARAHLPWAWNAGRPEWHGGFDRVEARPGEATRVSGWVVRGRGSVGCLTLSVDGRSLGRARLGIPRPDVALRFGSTEAFACGFQAVLPPSSLPAGSARIGAVADAFDPAGPGPRFELPPRDILWLPAREAVGPGRVAPPVRARSPHGPLRVAVFTHDLGLGGGQLFLLDLVCGLVAGGLEATVVAPRDGALREQLQRAGARVRLVGPYPHARRGDYEHAAAELSGWLSKGGFHCVLANTMGSFLGVDAAAQAGLPSAWAIHESFEPSVFWAVAYGSALDPDVRRRAETCLSGVGAAVFETEATRRLYASAVPAERMAVIPHGVDAEAAAARGGVAERTAARDRLGLPLEALVVLCMATVEPRKAQLRLVEAWAALGPRHPNAWLALVGDQPGLYSDTLHWIVGRRGLAERVLLVPTTDRTDLWYAAADILAGASDVESVPRSLLEAMAVGVCPAVAGVFGIPDAVEDGRSGFLCEPNDLADLIRVLDRALGATSEERARIAVAAQRVVRERFRRADCVAAYRDLLHRLVREPGAPAGLARPSAP